MDNLTFTKDRVIAWYVAAPQMWSFRPLADGEMLIQEQAAQLAELAGHRIYGRVTSRPYPVGEWAARHAANTPAPLPGFNAHMAREVEHLSGRSHDRKLVCYGVELGGRSRAQAQAVDLLAKLNQGMVDREVQAWQRRLAEVSQVMGGAGLEAAPASAAAMEWLLYRSTHLGLPLPLLEVGAGDPGDDLPDPAGFFETVRWHAEPYARSVVVTGRRGGEELRRHVVVLTVGRCGELYVPEEWEPWQARSERLGFPVEWAWRIDVRDSGEVTSEMQKMSGRIDAQWRHYSEDHHLRPPKALDRQARRAADIEDEMRSGFDGLSTRTRGWWRCAVAGATEAEAVERARAVADLYKPIVRMEHTFDQYRLAREFVPGEPTGSTAHVRHFPVLKAAAGFPAATAQIGDQRGIYLGTTAGFSERIATWDPWYLPEVAEATGLVPVAGGLGSGKSMLAGAVVYKTVQQGVDWTVLDPTGRFESLTALPELTSVSRFVPLVGAPPGLLCPYRVVPDPVREHYPDPDKHQLAIAEARASRRDLAADVLRWVLPPRLARRDSTEDLLYRAIGEVDPTATASPWQVIEALERIGGDEATAIAGRLREASEREQCRLFFPPAAGDVDDDPDRTLLLTVYSLKGIILPDRSRPEDEWSWDERLARPLINLASWLCLRAIYRGDPNRRKGVLFEEAHEYMEESASGRKLVQKCATDSRKHNAVVIASTQNAQRVLAADVANFVGAAFIGRTQDLAAQQAALQLVRLPTGAGYEQVLAGLSRRTRGVDERLGYREFIFADGVGGIEKLRVDLTNQPDLFAALDTTADPTRATATRTQNIAQGTTQDVPGAAEPPAAAESDDLAIAPATPPSSAATVAELGPTVGPSAKPRPRRWPAGRPALRPTRPLILLAGDADPELTDRAPART